MRIAICDDSNIFREQLQNELRDYYKSLDVSIIPFSSGEELLSAYEEKNIDIIFLDIEMDGIDGLETAKIIRSKNTNIPIIMLTSHTELAMAGYEIQAFRFLGKPVDREKLRQALIAVDEELHSGERIVINVDGIEEYVPCNDIMYIRSENVYLNIVTKNTSFLIRKKMKDFIKELPESSFAAVHRSYIVNLAFVQSFDGSSLFLFDNTEIPVARGNRDSFRQQIMRYMRTK